MSSYKEYYTILTIDPSEYDRLFSTLTVKVSEFFREPGVFALLKEIISSRLSDAEGLRAWSCGCAFGSEVYSLGILLSECLRPEMFHRAKIFATDIDGDALNIARRAIYRDELMKNIGDEIRERYFLSTAEGYKVKYNLRDTVRFGVLDIVKDPPISRIDILLCRNLLIYFEKHLQRRVLEKLDYALKPGGILVLGKAETLPASVAQGYTEIKKKSRVYIKRT